VYDFIEAVNSNFRSFALGLSPTVSEILPVFVRPETIFSYITPIPAKIWGVLFGVDM